MLLIVTSITSCWRRTADRAYVGSNDNKVYCLNAKTGEKIWSYETDDSIVSSPAVINGKVYIGSADGKVYCLRAKDGEKIWSYKTDDWVQTLAAVVEIM
jgi:outer membrane protein assembly factor BamB